MSRVRVVFLGEDPRDPMQAAAADYLARAGRRFDAALVALKPERRAKGGDDAKVRAIEAESLLRASDGCARVALDPRGTELDSLAFAKELEALLQRGKPVAFLVGGASGLHDDVREAADKTWSLSRLTFAHLLAVLVVAEQIYRAAEIARGGPYHK